MDSSEWNCCRTCLSDQNLLPIFSQPQHHEKYSSVIYLVTGVKVEHNDNLPQQICTVCINFINDSTKFRAKCEETNVQLLSRLNDKQLGLVKFESQTFKEEKVATIDISHLLQDLDDDFKDYDDNITLDNLQYHNSMVKSDNDTQTDTTNSNIEESVQNISNDKKNCKKEENCNKTKRRLRSSKQEKKEKEKIPKQKDERVKEEVECEYCHKMLTSKLSLRNHYKIHTGFDIVCEHCGKKFITKRLLLMHCRAKHGYEKTDKCSYCDYRASNAEQVKIHERLHTGERPYVCSSCGAGFHRKSSYLQHVAIHLPEKTVQCSQCPARFKSVTLMRIHASRHRAPVYSFQCRVCENYFARRRNVARHLQRVHGLPPAHHHIDRRKIA